jgi:hypothetical protein
MPQSTSTVGQKPQVGGEFLTFFLDDDEYGFEILKVQEIIGMMNERHTRAMDSALCAVVYLLAANNRSGLLSSHLRSINQTVIRPRTTVSELH